MLSCGRYTSQFLHPSQTRNVSSSGAGVKKFRKITASTGINSSSALEKSGYASETISKVGNHYESNTVIKQDLAAAAASQVEKIPLDYECPKESIATVELATQNLKGDCNESASKVNESEVSKDAPTAKDINESESKDSVCEEVVTCTVTVVIAETAFSGDDNANDPQQKEAEVVEREGKQE